MAVELTSEQLQLLDNIEKWYTRFPLGKPFFYYSGPAGTGKTTVLKALVEKLGLEDDEYITCAYVGKAVLVLQQHGLPATTIHSLIYYPRIEREKVVKADEFGNPVVKYKKKLAFTLRDHLENRHLKLIFMDECAMVNDKMREELQSFGIPLVMCGDHNQLPPIFGKATYTGDPDFVLTKIMRQKEGDPIIRLSQDILNREPIHYGDYGNVLVTRYVDYGKSLLTDYDVILCPTNRLREKMNDVIRYDLLRRDGLTPENGDRMICRRNDWSEQLPGGMALTNGLTGKVSNLNMVSIHRDILYCSFFPDLIPDGEFKKIPIDMKYLKLPWEKRKDYGWSKNDTELFEYAYALTVHLSQGSEYSSVLFMEENSYWDPDTLKRLRYTAVTRAKNKLVWVNPKLDTPRTFSYGGNVFNVPTQ